jgi:lipid A ethanolaminephosphotransferase
MSQLIEFLKTKKNYHVSLIYVSDHGESLGEKGFYLHGAPFALTKEEQGHPASFMWFNDLKLFNINKDCLLKQTQKTYSHYNMFHSILGLFDIENQYYNENLDLFKECKEL